MTKIIDSVNSPADIKTLSLAELEQYAGEIRAALLQKVSDIGGHVGPNLAVVELTIALHKVFNSPQDKIVWDVSHQSYPHKIITGRKSGYLNPAKYNSITGYTTPKESEHDFFTVGHTSTSISLATGLATARDVKGTTENIIAVIGDGSLSGGQAFEGLNNGGRMQSNLIVIVNDNNMSIAPNEGSLYQNLALLRKTQGTAETNIFKALGFDYHYVGAGNDLATVIAVLEKVKDTDHPVLIHLQTLKGKGYKPAEENQEPWHYHGPFDLATGEAKTTTVTPSYADVVAEHLCQRAQTDDLLMVIQAAVPGALRINKFRQLFPGKYIDVGIAEQQGISMASGMAKGGAHPVAIFRSTFLNRAYDQVIQDLSIDNNPATIVVEGGSITSADVTHLGVFDIPMLSNIPNLIYLAPTTKQELEYMIDWAIEYQAGPVAIRTPEHAITENLGPVEPITKLNTSVVTYKGSKVAILALGGFYQLGVEVGTRLVAQNIAATLINPRFISGLDTELLHRLLADHELVVTLEDGMLEGGYGAKVASFYGPTAMKVLNIGAKKVFTDRTPMEEIKKMFHLTPELIVEDINKILFGE